MERERGRQGCRYLRAGVPAKERAGGVPGAGVPKKVGTGAQGRTEAAQMDGNFRDWVIATSETKSLGFVSIALILEAGTRRGPGLLRPGPLLHKVWALLTRFLLHDVADSAEAVVVKGVGVVEEGEAEEGEDVVIDAVVEEDDAVVVIIEKEAAVVVPEDVVIGVSHGGDSRSHRYRCHHGDHR